MSSIVENNVEKFNTAWEGFKGGRWESEVDTRGFIQANYTEYRGDDSFLEGIAPSTDQLWTKLQELFEAAPEQREESKEEARLRPFLNRITQIIFKQGADWVKDKLQSCL